MEANQEANRGWLADVDLSLPYDDSTIPTELAIAALRWATHRRRMGQPLEPWNGRIPEYPPPDPPASKAGKWEWMYFQLLKDRRPRELYRMRRESSVDMFLEAVGDEARNRITNAMVKAVRQAQADNLNPMEFIQAGQRAKMLEAELLRADFEAEIQPEDEDGADAGDRDVTRAHDMEWLQWLPDSGEILYRAVYVGELESREWSWKRTDADQGVLPPRFGPFFPEAWELNLQIVREIESGELEGKTLPWGGYVANATGLDIGLIVEDCYGDHAACVTKSGRSAIDEAMYHVFFECVDTLMVGKHYALVAFTA